MKVLVAISGGPESLVTAWLLKKQGMQLRGVYIDLLGIDNLEDKISSIERRLGFSIQVIKAKDEMRAVLSGNRDDARNAGRAFRPKDFFHQNVLFPKLFELREQHQFAKIAAGHRVSIHEDPVAGVSRVMRYSDPSRDESTLLLGLNQKELSSLILPLGSIPESMMSKLTLELDPKGETETFEMNWEQFSASLPTKILQDSIGFDVFSVQGVRLGNLKDKADIAPGMIYLDPDDPHRRYRVIDVSPQAKRVLVIDDNERKVEEVLFQEGYWFTKSDLKFETLTCNILWEGHGKLVPIKLIQYEGNRLRGVLEQPLIGEEANIFKGQTVLWIEGQEVLGGGKVLRTK